MEKRIAKVGDYLNPDGWSIGEVITKSDGYSDESFKGCDFRIKSIGGNLAINIVTTGSPRLASGMSWRSRCKIEFVGDGDESTFCGGWLYNN